MIVAIAGNAVENVVGITLAAKGQSDLAISVVKNSVAQIAVFVFPALVLLSLFLEHRLTFVLGPVYIGALLLTALAMWQITGDGEAVGVRGLGARRPVRHPRRADLVRVAARRLSTSSVAELAPRSRLEAGEVEPGVAAAVEAANRVADRFEHALDLVLAALVDGELDPRAGRGDGRGRVRWRRRRGRRRRSRRRSASSLGRPSTSAS